MEEKIHVFEKAGLGKAPFKLIGFEEKRGPIIVSQKNDVRTTVGSPGQPMGSCRYCGTGIANCFWLESADGKRFYVGSECVQRRGDAGLKKAVKKIESQRRRAAAERRRAKDETIIARAIELHRTELDQIEHPMKWRREQGDTYLDYVKFYQGCSGNKGHREMAKLLVKRYPELAQEPDNGKP